MSSARSGWAAILAVMIALAGCRDRSTTSPAGATTTASGSAVGSGSGSAAQAPEYDKDEYVPAEFKTGADRWRDTGVYVDGVFQGLLAFAELPLALEPVWLEVKASAPKRAGTSDTGWRLVKERRYRFTAYLTALGLDLKSVRALHVYGPKFSESIVVTGAELRSNAAAGFMFRFGALVSGKGIPVVPDGFGNGKSPDKISAVMIYVTKPPPELVRNVGLVLDGQVTTGVPYYGTPHRGGVRVYLDDKLVAYIKRQELRMDQATQVPDGDPRWGLFATLRGQGVDVDRVVEGWVVRDEQWHERLTRAELEPMWFSAGMQAKGHLELGDAHVKVQALILRSAPLDPARVPRKDPAEE